MLKTDPLEFFHCLFQVVQCRLAYKGSRMRIFTFMYITLWSLESWPLGAWIKGETPSTCFLTPSLLFSHPTSPTIHTPWFLSAYYSFRSFFNFSFLPQINPSSLLTLSFFSGITLNNKKVRKNLLKIRQKKWQNEAILFLLHLIVEFL